MEAQPTMAPVGGDVRCGSAVAAAELGEAAEHGDAAEKMREGERKMGRRLGRPEKRRTG